MKIKSLLLIILLLSLTIPVGAQTSRGTVNGIVSDPTGAVIAGAIVTLTHNQTGVTRSTTSNEEGAYRFDAVDLGTYSVKVAAPSFGAVTKTNVAVSANQTATVDVQLSPTGGDVVVDVSAGSGELLQSQAPVRGGNIEQKKIVELPFATRNPVSLALTLPGVSSNRFGFGVATFSVNGSRGRSNNFLIDGTENNDISVAGQAFQITNPDAVAEVSVQTSNYDAEFGRAGGAVVNTITRSGTNNYHGTLSYLVESTRFNAITSTIALNPEVQRRRRPLPGTDQFFSGTFGGPIKRERTFFFGAFQEQRTNASGTVNLVTISAAGRARLRGLFPEGRNRNVDTFLTATAGADATSQFFTQDLGNGRGPIEFGTAIASFPNQFRDRQWQARIDHKLGENDQLSGRYLYDDQDAPTGGGGGFPSFITSNKNRFQNFLIAETHVFSSHLTNELRLAYNRITLAFPNDAKNPLGQTLPAIDPGLPFSIVGVATNIPQGRIANNYLLQDTASYIIGNHTFRFGTELMQQRSRQFAPIVERGLLTYRSSPGRSDFANFVDDFGGSGGGARRDFGSAAYYPELFRQAYFGQDRWRVSDALTLTLGLRYEYFGLPINAVRTAAFTGLFNVDPATLTGPFSQPNQVEPDKNNFSPTLGIAYTPAFKSGWLSRVFGDKRSVIRGGYQIGYDSFFNNIASNAQTSAPNVVATNLASTVSTANPRGLANVSGALPLAPRPLSPFDSQVLVVKNLVNPYYQRWSLGVQRELPGSFLLDVSYVGSKGTKLFINEDLNPLVPAALRVTPAGYTGATSGRLDNLQGSRLIRTNGGSSSYHSGQLFVQRRFANGFTMSAAYTYSKLIDNASEVFGVANNNQPQQAAVPSILGGQARERGVSLFDRTHRASFTYVYELPWMRDQKGVLGRVVGGWQIAGITTFESGAPLTVSNGQDADSIGGNLDRPDFNPNGRFGVRAVPSASSPTGYVNPDNNNAPINRSDAMFIGIAANSGRTGNLGRNTLRTPGINNTNLTLTKRVAITEGSRIEFRTEFFNVFNHPQFTNISASAFAPTSGASTTISASVFGSPAGRFLMPEFADGGGRVVRFQLKYLF
ncbi:MAG: TonB-dependent receptor [Acidobacteria bacterium]|nr:TonB-dependent receptor [Acidobacteriota bacterium]